MDATISTSPAPLSSCAYMHDSSGETLSESSEEESDTESCGKTFTNGHLYGLERASPLSPSYEFGRPIGEWHTSDSRGRWGQLSHFSETVR
jgi:hypothetical protein